jgi:threonine dehydrogenase-like Zn-dependent dehydrogenase
MRGMHAGMRLLTSGRLDLSDLVSHRFELDGIQNAFEIAHDKPPGFIKATVGIDG